MIADVAVIVLFGFAAIVFVLLITWNAVEWFDARRRRRMEALRRAASAATFNVDILDCQFRVGDEVMIGGTGDLPLGLERGVAYRVVDIKPANGMDRVQFRARCGHPVLDEAGQVDDFWEPCSRPPHIDGPCAHRPRRGSRVSS